jgi:hypothetical protein
MRTEEMGMALITWKRFRTCGLLAASLAFLAAYELAASAQNPTERARSGAEPSCVAIVLPDVEGVEGSATEVATALQQLFVSDLSGPTSRVIALEARLPSQAGEEASQKHCDRLLSAKLTRKRGGRGMLGKVFVDAASTAVWLMPGGATVGSAVVRGVALAGAQAVGTLALTTKAKDELRLEYRLTSPDGSARFGPKTDKAKAQTDGEDLLTPMVRRASEAIAADVATK